MQPRKFRRVTLGFASLAIGAFLATSARADIYVTFSIDGGASSGPIDVAPGSPAQGALGYSPGFSVMEGPFSVEFGSIVAQQIGGTELESGTVSITNTTGATHSITVTILSTLYTSPTAPPTAILEQSVGGSVNNATNANNSANTLSLNSSVTDGTNSYSGIAMSPTITSVGSYSAPSPNGTTQNTPVPLLYSPFSISTVETVQLGALASIQINNTTSLISTPEPATIGMALSALPLIGIGVYARRRRARA